MLKTVEDVLFKPTAVHDHVPQISPPGPSSDLEEARSGRDSKWRRMLGIQNWGSGAKFRKSPMGNLGRDKNEVQEGTT